MTRKRRTRLDLIALLIKVSSIEYITLYDIIIHTGMNRRLAKPYVEFLVKQGFLERNNLGRVSGYRATERGLRWLEKYISLKREVDQ